MARMAIDWGIRTYILRLDLEKAFDTVRQQRMGPLVLDAVGSQVLAPNHPVSGSDAAHGGGGGKQWGETGKPGLTGFVGIPCGQSGGNPLWPKRWDHCSTNPILPSPIPVLPVALHTWTTHMSGAILWSMCNRLRAN